MHKPVNPQAKEDFVRFSKAAYAAHEYLREWYEFALTRLPIAAGNVAIAQGRCQVLGELMKLLSDAPEKTAQGASPANPRTP